VLDQEEAMNWMKILLKKDDLSADEVNTFERLVSELGFLPLALVQAAAYLRQHSNCSVDAYLKLFLESPLLAFEGSTYDSASDMLDNNNLRMRKIIFRTWDISLKSIDDQYRACSQPNFSSSLFENCAFFAGKNIPVALLEKLLEAEANYPDASLLPFLVDQYLTDLLRYSLIQRNSTQNSISIHQLVQESLRVRVNSNFGKQTVVCSRIIEGISKFDLNDTESLELSVRNAQVVSHFSRFRQLLTNLSVRFQLKTKMALIQLGIDCVDSLMKFYKYEEADATTKDALAWCRQLFSEYIPFPQSLIVEFGRLVANVFHGCSWLVMNIGKTAEEIRNAMKLCDFAIQALACIMCSEQATKKDVQMYILYRYNLANMYDVLYIKFGKSTDLEKGRKDMVDAINWIEGKRSMICTEFAAEYPHEYAQCYHTLADISRSLGDYATSIMCYEHALQIGRAAFHVPVPYLQRKLGEVLYMDKQYISAENAFKQAGNDYQEQEAAANAKQLEIHVDYPVAILYAWLEDLKIAHSINFETWPIFARKGLVEKVGECKSAVELRRHMIASAYSKAQKGQMLMLGNHSLKELEQSFLETLPEYETIDAFFFDRTSPDPTYYFATGSPLFDPFSGIVAAASLDNLEKCEIRNYRTPYGIDLYRQTLADFFSSDVRCQQNPVQKENVVFTTGITGAFAAFLLGVLERPYDAVLIPVPTYGMFISQAFYFSRVVIPVPLSRDNGWILRDADLENSIYEGQQYLKYLRQSLGLMYEPQIRGFLSINPHNPTGAVYNKVDIENLSRVLGRYPSIKIFENLAYWGITYAKSIL
jgi:tetratricopeptide (TPR) repeat protein